jgi:hypothetical protein
MTTGITRYDPPGFMTDFDGIDGQLEQWSDAVSGWFDEVVAKEERELGGQRCQYFNQLTSPQPEPLLPQAIVWNAFPGTLRRRFGEAASLEVAETMLPLSVRDDGQGPFYVGPKWANLYYRPHHEYCEWRAERDEYGNIVRVVFTSEPPEYWQALWGGKLPDLKGKAKYDIKGNPDVMLDLYREYVSPEVQLDDLRCAENFIDYSDPKKPEVVYEKGAYNPYNRWNTTDGIMHLTHPANSLQAEIQLGGDATILRQSHWRPVVNPDALICGTRYGGANRCSDPTIGATVNELAALGCWVTLRNPVGLYMDHLDLTGITTPQGAPIEPDYFTVLRGDEADGLIERAVFEVPAGKGFEVGDLKIGGRPIEYAGQLAKLMTVKLVGLAAGLDSFANHPMACTDHALIDPGNPAYLIQPRPEREPAGNEVVAFDYPDVKAPPAPAPKVPAQTTAQMQARLKAQVAKQRWNIPPGQGR